MFDAVQLLRELNDGGYSDREKAAASDGFDTMGPRAVVVGGGRLAADVSQVLAAAGKEDMPLTMKADVTGSLCENNDKFAVQRDLPQIETGDLLIIHDAGAHSRAMGFNYNGALRCGELLLKEDGTIKEIRRKETPEDYFSTMIFD